MENMSLLGIDKAVRPAVLLAAPTFISFVCPPSLFSTAASSSATSWLHTLLTGIIGAGRALRRRVASQEGWSRQSDADAHVHGWSCMLATWMAMRTVENLLKK